MHKFIYGNEPKEEFKQPKSIFNPVVLTHRKGHNENQMPEFFDI